MRRIALLISALLLISVVAVGDDGSGLIVVLDVAQAIGPATSDYLHRNFARATREHARLIVIRIDTPGGLDDSMRQIVQDIVASPVPVAVYVAPAGGRAASAGTYIAYAAHIAAMAPATNLGAATPVPLGELPEFGTPPALPAGGNKDKKSDRHQTDKEPAPTQGKAVPAPASAMERKIRNDAVAYLQSLAQLRGRNAEWAAEAVREGASLSANEALAHNVVDLVVPDLDALLAALDGRAVKMRDGSRTLHLKDAVVETFAPDWRSRLLAVITSPNIAYLLMLLGFYGLFFELAAPGHVLPGVVGAISLLLALYAFNVLPVNYAGLALIMVGIAFMAGEMVLPSFGALGIGGVFAFVSGSIILFDSGIDNYAVSLPLIGAVALLSAAFFMGVLAMALRIYRRPAVTGVEQLIGSSGEVLDDFAGVGRVRTHGEIWRACARTPLERGQRVRVAALDGLTLIVEPMNQEN